MDLNRLPEDIGTGGLGGSSPGSSSGEDMCSVCHETLKRDQDRTVVQLRCLHQFHLDCIGSAFNAKGGMECPNCRKVEIGEWKFPNGVPASSSLTDLWNYEDDDEYDYEYDEVIDSTSLPNLALSLQLQWCPYNLEHISAPLSEVTHISNNYTHIHQLVGPIIPSEVQMPMYGFAGLDEHGLLLNVTPGVHMTSVEHNSLSSAVNAYPFPVQNNSSVNPFYQVVHPGAQATPLSVQQQYYMQQPYSVPVQSHQATNISTFRPMNRTGLSMASVNQGGSYFSPSMATTPLQNFIETGYPASTEPPLSVQTALPSANLSGASSRLNRHNQRARRGQQTSTATARQNQPCLPQ